eukprot:46183-Eustigmatos_ZCMA.PRE.1
MGRNLLSVDRMTEKGASVLFTPTGTVIERSVYKVPLRRAGRLQWIDLSVDPCAGDSCAGGSEQAHVATEATLWHSRLGHRNYADIRRLGDLDLGVPKGVSDAGAA